jgi:hypothetical protein
MKKNLDYLESIKILLLLKYFRGANSYLNIASPNERL